MTETRENRLKRLHMRSMRRGIKEMDIILEAFAKSELEKMSQAELDIYDALLHENDQDLYGWITSQSAVPQRFVEIVQRISTQIGG